MTWSLDDVAWDRFDRGRVRPEFVSIAKAACLIEHNGGDYGDYLCSVFRDDPDFCAAARTWAAEEIKHGEALRRWVEMVDPTFDFDSAFARFTERVRLPLTATESVRGSRCMELIARCVVEVGTSSYYCALRDAADEPVFKEICRRIAGDEFRHYKLFFDHMKRYRKRENPILPRRVWAVLGRFLEAEDDELAYAYFCGNAVTSPYRRRTYRRAYARKVFACYRFDHIEHGAAMVLKAVGLRPRSWYGRLITRLLWWIYRARAGRFAPAAA